MGKILSKIRQSLLAKPFPFEDLPDVCKMHVFSYLDVADRVALSMVCTEWHDMLRSPVLWGNVDVTLAVKMLQRKQANRNISVRELAVRERTMKYLSYVCAIDPVIHRLVLVGDMIDAEYYQQIRNFTRSAKLTELHDIDIDWTSFNGDALKLPGAAAVDENRRRRQRLFTWFFEHLAKSAPNLRSLSLQFDWSPKSVETVVSLSKLERITLRQYNDMQTLDVALVDRLISSLPELRSLTVEAWTACAFSGLTYYRICSDTLEDIDLSECRGFALGDVHLPRAYKLCISRWPWTGPLTKAFGIFTTRPQPPCLYRILAQGAPSLVQLNDHILQPGWTSETYEELEEVMKTICPCELHCLCAAVGEGMCM